MPVRTAIITQAAEPGLLDRSRKRPDALLGRAAGAVLAGLLVGSAGAGPAGWWTTVVGMSLLALSTLKARPTSAMIAGSLAGAVAVGAWQATSAAASTVLAIAAAIALAAVAGAMYGAIARVIQQWPAWPLALPLVWLAIETLVSGAVPLPSVDPVAIAQIPGQQTSSVIVLAAGLAIAFLLGLASCTLAAAVAGMRRSARVRTVLGSLAVAVASLGILVVLESAVHAHDTLSSNSLSAHVTHSVSSDATSFDA